VLFFRDNLPSDGDIFRRWWAFYQLYRSDNLEWRVSLQVAVIPRKLVNFRDFREISGKLTERIGGCGESATVMVILESGADISNGIYGYYL
jgi:hypothetical protein